MCPELRVILNTSRLTTSPRPSSCATAPGLSSPPALTNNYRYTLRFVLLQLSGVNATQRSVHVKVDIRRLLKVPVVFSLSLASLHPDPGRHLPGFSAAGALQFSGLPVSTGALLVCAEAQASQFGGGRASARRPKVYGAQLDGLGRV